jgi:hypothetical protein
VNPPNHVRTAEVQQIVIALQLLGTVDETRSAIVVFGKIAVLHHRAHRPVQEDDALFQQFAKRVLASGGSGHGAGSRAAALVPGMSPSE